MDSLSHCSSSYGMDARSPTTTETPSSGTPSIAVTTPDSLSQLIEKRTASWSYLERAHSSSPDRWFQTVQISQAQIERHLVETLGSVKFAQKTRNLFVLGMSLGPVLKAEGPTEFCKALIRVLDEWEIWNEGTLNGRATGGVVSGLELPILPSHRLIYSSLEQKNLFRNQRSARKSTSSSVETPYDLGNPGNPSHPNSSSGTSSPGVSRSTSALVMINLPFALDYCQVVTTLCNMFRQLYNRLEELVQRPSFIGSSAPRHNTSPMGTSPPNGNRSATSPYSTSFSASINSATGPTETRQGAWGSTAGAPGGRTGSYVYGLGVGTGGAAGSSVTWPTGLAEQITRFDQKLKVRKSRTWNRMRTVQDG